MAGFDSTNLGGITKRVYDKNVIERSMNYTAPFLAMLKSFPGFKTGGDNFARGSLYGNV